jgi:hypothetical protein
MREDAPLVSEIDDFSRSYNEATRYHHQPQQAREPQYVYETPAWEVPPFAPQHALAGEDMGPLDLVPGFGGAAAAAAAPLRRGGSEESERERQRERDRLMGEDKEGEASSSARGFGYTNVREEGWSPQQLRPSPPRERDIMVGPNVQRYQLVDEAPREAPVLHSPGQLRGKGPRGRNSP